MKKSFDVKLGNILRAKRQDKGFSMEYVAQQLKVTKMTISHWETGTRSMYAEPLRDYCRLLGITMQEAFDLMEKTS